MRQMTSIRTLSTSPCMWAKHYFTKKNRWNPESSARCCADTNLTKLNLTAQEILKALCHTMPVFFGGDVFRQKCFHAKDEIPKAIFQILLISVSTHVSEVSFVI